MGWLHLSAGFVRHAKLRSFVDPGERWAIYHDFEGGPFSFEQKNA